MSQTTGPPTNNWTAADLINRFGPIPLHRIRHDPAPGTACEQDLVLIHDHEDRLYELVDGTLVEKAPGTFESYVAGVIVRLLGNFVAENHLGIVLPPDGMMRIAPGLVRIPDVSFVSWDRLPNRRIPDQAIADLVPDLAVEVISRSNTREEMERKLAEYFDAGVRYVWYVYPSTREVHYYTSKENAAVFGAGENLHGGDILPGITIRIDDLFAQPGSRPE